MASLKTGVTRALRSRVPTQNPLLRAGIQRGITATAKTANWTSTTSPTPQSSTPVSFPLSGTALISSIKSQNFASFAHPFSRSLPTTTAAKNHPTSASAPQPSHFHKSIHNPPQRHNPQPNNHPLASPPNPPLPPPLLLLRPNPLVKVRPRQPPKTIHPQPGLRRPRALQPPAPRLDTRAREPNPRPRLRALSDEDPPRLNP